LGETTLIRNARWWRTGERIDLAFSDGRVRAVRGLSKREALGRLLDVEPDSAAAACARSAASRRGAFAR